jgi:Tfp pilus assembly protein PilE
MMAKNLKSTSGFTLVELLLATVIMTFLVFFMAQAFRQTAMGNSLSINKAELVDDVRTAGQMISDYARNAVYVYPPGTTLTLQRTPTFIAANDYAVTNPRTNDNTWVVGQDNIVAFIMAPDRGLNPLFNAGVTVTCDPTEPAPTPFVIPPTIGGADDSMCLTFVAYYVVARSNVVSKTPNIGAGSGNNPGLDPLNNDRGILYEYKLSLPIDRLAGTNISSNLPAPPPTTIGGPYGVKPNYNTTPGLVADDIDVGLPKFNFVLKTPTCLANLANKGRYLNSLGGLVPATVTGFTVVYDPTNFNPGCPTALNPKMQQKNGALDSFASMAQATLTISASRKNQFGNTTSTGDLIFPIAPINLLVPGT